MKTVFVLLAILLSIGSVSAQRFDVKTSNGSYPVIFSPEAYEYIGFLNQNLQVIKESEGSQYTVHAIAFHPENGHFKLHKESSEQRYLVFENDPSSQIDSLVVTVVESRTKDSSIVRNLRLSGYNNNGTADVCEISQGVIQGIARVFVYRLAKN